MSTARLLLNCYFERLYELLEQKKSRLCQRATELLENIVREQNIFPLADRDKFQAYHDAVQAFIIERIESYNPIGQQYSFDGITSQEAFEIDLQLNWYDSRAEFTTLQLLAKKLTSELQSDDQLPQLADKIIAQCGAYPDQSIIKDYQSDPDTQKLPDYIVSLTIEEIIK
ncbi:MAG: hypothetical protein JXD22_15095 [Sedimentisphaerales bacterium]|nr:hypothetical protein [Sedimentisphaerales bacterium]